MVGRPILRGHAFHVYDAVTGPDPRPQRWSPRERRDHRHPFTLFLDLETDTPVVGVGPTPKPERIPGFGVDKGRMGVIQFLENARDSGLDERGLVHRIDVLLRNVVQNFLE